VKILIIRFSSIGDIVLTTPVVRCLKLQLGAEVHYLTKKSFRGILDSNPYIDKVFAIDKEVKEVLPELKKQNYDYIIDLHKNLRTLQVRLNLRTKTYSFQKLNWQKWLMTKFKINHLPTTHIVDRYLHTVKKLGTINDGKGLDYFIPAKDEIVNPKSTFVAFVTGAAHFTKRLPEEKIIAMCQKIAEPIVLLGGKDEAEKGDRIAKAAGSHVTNLCGKLNLNQSASMVKQASYVISHDTGLMHIAAAFQKRIVSVWGNTIPEFGMYPYYATDNQNKGLETRLEVKGLSCRPCSKIGHQACPMGHFKCMEEIEI
jgi:ADP-heptose:LPS heptosyltransferase